MVEGQRGVPGAGPVPWAEPGNHRLHRHVGEAERRGRKDVSNAGVDLGYVALVRRDQLRGDLLPQHTG